MKPEKEATNLPGTTFTFPHENSNKRQRHITGIFNENGCLLCTSHKTKDGRYSRTKRNKRDWRIHRYIFSRFCEEIPEGYVVRHKCDEPLCINPDHLELGTTQDNNNDKMKRGRQYSKLTYDQAYYIKFISTETVKELADKYHVNKATIADIKKGKTWKHVTIEMRKVA